MAENLEFETHLREAFINGLDLTGDVEVASLKFGQHPHWDSLGHMSLISTLEEMFDVTLDGKEVGQIDSYLAAIRILSSKIGPLS